MSSAAQIRGRKDTVRQALYVRQQSRQQPPMWSRERRASWCALVLRQGMGRSAASNAASMRWTLSHRFDAEVLPLADRHYNRRKVGSPQFVPPGRCIVLKTPCLRAVWTTSWPFMSYVRHRWPGAWVNSLFRNEGAGLSSELILEAVAVTRGIWHHVPAYGMVSFVDATKIRRKRDPGRCYLRAGFEHVGYTKGGLHVFQLWEDRMPPAAAPLLELANTA